MLTAYSLVTVVTSERTIDLALPSGLPLSDVVPQVLRYAAPDRADAGPLTWTLARLGGSSLALTQTLQDAGVLDGEVLELRAQADDVRPALVEDVRDAVEDSVDAAGGVWSTRTTGSFVVVGASLVLLALGLVGLVLWLLDGSDLLSGVPAGVSVVVLLALTAWAGRLGREVDAQWSAAVAMVWAALGGLVLSYDVSTTVGQGLAVTAALAALVAGVARLLTPAATAHAAVGVVVLVSALLQLLVETSGLDDLDGTRVVPVLAILAVGVLPRVSLSVGGLASADYRVRHVGQLDLAALQRRYRDSNAILVGSLVGIALVVAAAATVLDLQPGAPWDRTLAVSLAAAALLRSRVFSRTQHLAPLRVAAVAIAVVALVRWALLDASLSAYVVPLVCVVAVAALGLASLPLSEITRARVKRTLNLVEFLVIVVLLVVLAGSLDLYTKLGGII